MIILKYIEILRILYLNNSIYLIRTFELLLTTNVDLSKYSSLVNKNIKNLLIRKFILLIIINKTPN